MQDLIDLISDDNQWASTEPIVHHTFSHLIQLFQKFNNKLSFLETTIYSKPPKTKSEQINKTLQKQSNNHKQTSNHKQSNTLKQSYPHLYHPLHPQSAFKQTLQHKQTSKGKSSKHEIFPQQLYLESNETMFAMLVQQIQNLKIKSSKSCNHNNQTQIYYQTDKEIIESILIKYDQLEKQIELINDIVSQTVKEHKYSNTNCIQQVKELITDLQKQIKDKPERVKVQQIIRKQIDIVNREIEQIEEYTETNLASINKILNHQSSINAEICHEMKIGKWIWEGISKAILTLIPWEKQLINLFPQNIIWNQDTTTMIIKEPGFYEIELMVIGSDCTLGLILNDQTSVFQKQSDTNTFSHKYTDILEVSQNSNLSVSIQNQATTIILILKKIY